MSADTPDVPGCRAYFKDSCPPCLSERTGGGRCDDTPGCTCPRTDGYRIKHRGCPAHADKDAAYWQGQDDDG